MSLYLGHHESEDLDFFTSNYFDPIKLQPYLLHLGKLSNTELAENTLNTYIDSTKIQFLYYPYPNIEAFIEWNGIKISSMLDIACTKIITISIRGSKKDFVDLYFLLKKFSLSSLLDSVNQKYQGIDYNTAHLLKSLVYFEDAEQQPMPRMHQDISWNQIKTEKSSEIKNLKFSE